MADGVALEDLLHPFLGRYLSAPEWLKSSAGRAYRALPEAVRMGGAYGEFRSQLAADGGPGPMARLDIKRHPDRYLSRAMPPAARLETYTGGSTRHPMRFFLQKDRK